MPSNIDGEETKISSRKVKQSNNEGIPSRSSEDAGIHKLPPRTFYGKTYDSFESTLFDGENEEYFEAYYYAMHQDDYKI